jgi:hypothetical protein
VQADVSPDTDPNNPLIVTPPPDDTIDVEVRNLNRTNAGSGIFGDIVINSFDIACSNNTLDSANNIASLTIPAESTATITVLVASGAFKQANTGTLRPGGLDFSDVCSITFVGEDLGGEPIISRRAVFGITYVDIP